MCCARNSVTHFDQTTEDSCYDVPALQNLTEPKKTKNRVCKYILCIVIITVKKNLRQH
jgi:hypothetical protein